MLNLFATITGLALVDAINVCAFAVLSMVLVTILIQNPDKKKKVLTGGLAFVVAVFIMYFIYGIIFLQLFNTMADKIASVSPYVFNFLVVLIMIIGALNIKDYFMYSPGGIATEMPLSIRPRAKLLIQKATSPKGTFIVGIFVTLFLLPCTIAPLITAMGKLSAEGYTFITSIPWLMYYNFLFVLPMIAITLIIYYGFSKVEDISDWKERNIKYLHLIAGIVLFVVGFLLLMGWL